MPNPQTPPLAILTDNLCRLVGVGEKDIARLRELKEGIPGWSELAHYIVFRELLRTKPNASVLMCGVYHGLDLTYMAGIAQDLGQTVRLVGVDLFENAETTDWPDEDKGKGLTWEQSSFHAPGPSMEASKKNCPTAELHKGDAVAFMRNCQEKFDIIFLDDAHDLGTLMAEIPAALAILKPGGLLAGDDYIWCKNEVKQAVCELLPHHAVLFQRIWVAEAP